MTPEEIKAAYELSARPYIDAPGPMSPAVLGMRSWRYVLEVSSMCNLRCSLCHAGNREGYEYKPGVMDPALMEKILDKIANESPGSIVCCYVNSDPFLHPRIHEVVRSIKSRGLRCELATNANFISNLDQVLAAKPNLFTMSVSGWSQEVYERAHRGGNIETVKKNIKEIAEARVRGAHFDVMMGVSYHMYNDNLGEEMEQMRKFTESLGILFMISWGRVITIENTVQAIRHLEKLEGKTVKPFKLWKGIDLNKIFPPAKAAFIKGMERLRFHPKKAEKFYSRWPVSPICLVADVFTEIRWDGRVQLCAWTDDMRLTLGNYLEMSQEQISEARRGHPLCEECLRMRLNYYFHITNASAWDSMNEST